MRTRVRWIYEVWRPIRCWFAVLLVLTALSTAAAIAYPLVLRAIVDALASLLHVRAAGSAASRGSDSAVAAEIHRLLLLLLGVGGLRLLSHLYPAARAYLNNRIERDVRQTYFAIVMRKGYHFFQRFRTGDLVTRLTDDITEFPRISWFCCSAIFRALESSSKLVFCLAVMFWLDWRLALLASAPLPPMLVVVLLVQHSFGRRVVHQRRAVSETNDLLEASFSGVRIVKAANAEHRQGDALRRQLARRFAAEMRVVRMEQLVHALHASCGIAGQIIVVSVGGILVIRGQMSPGTLYAFYAYLAMLSAPLLDLPGLFVFGRQAFVCIDRLEELRAADVQGEGGAFRGEAAPGSFAMLELCGVWGGYAPAPAAAPNAGATAGGDVAAAWSNPDGAVLRGITVELRRAERVAVVGRLGSGKSTLLRIASGALVPVAGEVRLNGRPLAEYGRAGFGRLAATVTQEPLLLRGTIRENIVLGRKSDEAWLAAVLDAVGMTAEVAAFSHGLDEQLGQGGLGLSGGQKQRIAIARALYGRPQLLLLDDLTSALDATNEDRLWRALPRLCPDAAILVVTHRIATARAMSRILVLEGGAIAAAGAHAELLAVSQLYRELQHDWIDPANANDDPGRGSAEAARSASHAGPPITGASAF
ncbi:MAG: ABC transporter ATP-binding protein [Candidatus Schekmanbacteria bacterium]|nr:ABC transporter ATP-binding protein [Candidatus Schekmanbacteria bacterium]